MFGDANQTLVMSHFGVHRFQEHLTRIRSAIPNLGMLRHEKARVFVFSADPKDMAMQKYYDHEARSQVGYTDFVTRLRIGLSFLLPQATIKDIHYGYNSGSGIGGFAIVDTSKGFVETNLTKEYF